jgi:hypothetical protein
MLAEPSGTVGSGPSTWTEHLDGDDEVTLGDERFDYEELIDETPLRAAPGRAALVEAIVRLGWFAADFAASAVAAERS